jgi:hypothetical protein
MLAGGGVVMPQHAMPPYAASRSVAARSFSPSEWDLLVRLPGRVLVAAVSVDADRARRGVADDLAGIEAIAAGRSSPSALVNDIVATIYAESHPEQAGEPPDVGAVLAGCRHATRTLDDRARGADAAGYRDWLMDIATATCATRYDDDRVGPAEWCFLADLALALTL